MRSDDGNESEYEDVTYNDEAKVVADEVVDYYCCELICAYIHIHVFTIHTTICCCYTSAHAHRCIGIHPVICMFNHRHFESKQ